MEARPLLGPHLQDGRWPLFCVAFLCSAEKAVVGPSLLPQGAPGGAPVKTGRRPKVGYPAASHGVPSRLRHVPSADCTVFIAIG